MTNYYSYVPHASNKLLQYWIEKLNVCIRITKPRKTKLGDFKVVNKRMYISVNNDLNPYSFLITLTHELAHAFVYLDYKFLVSPHGKEWKHTFKKMMLNFLNTSCFPEDVLRILSRHLISPKASTMSDFELAYVLNKYNFSNELLLYDIDYGSRFSISNGKKFLKGNFLRKRFRCTDLDSGKDYYVHPLTKVELLK